MGTTTCNGEHAQPQISNPQDAAQPQNKQSIIVVVDAPHQNHQISKRSSSINQEIIGGQPNAGKPSSLNLNDSRKDQFQKIQMFSVKKTNKINFETIQVMDNKQKKKRINQFQIQVPFSVVILSISKQLRLIINQIGVDIFRKYYNDTNGSGWKLHKNGYYINYLGKKLTAILTEHSYFQGELYDEDNKILPKARGILLNQNGRYEGHFQKGKAQGRGTYDDFKNTVFYNGLWEQGKMVQGVIQCPEYKFKGKLKNSMAHGQGELHFKQKQIFYTGKFKKGAYYDKDALYETKDYVYQGCFVNGRKNGEGTLVQKQRNYNKDKKLKYRPPTQYEGQFSNDIFLNKQVVHQQTSTSQQKEEPGAMKQTISKLKPQQFQQEEEVIEKKPQDITLNKNAVLEDQYDQLRPKFIWVEPPRIKKAKKPQVDVDQF